MKDYAIYTIVSMAIIVVIVLASSGEFIPLMVAFALMLVMRSIFRTQKGRKWFRTFYRVGEQFDLFLKNQVKDSK